MPNVAGLIEGDIVTEDVMDEIEVALGEAIPCSALRLAAVALVDAPLPVPRNPRLGDTGVDLGFLLPISSIFPNLLRPV